MMRLCNRWKQRGTTCLRHRLNQPRLDITCDDKHILGIGVMGRSINDRCRLKNSGMSVDAITLSQNYRPA
ncbi:hypothetical protein TNCV_1321411 [Trichonephila clavipes]|nr:hypothetical protein TNCV_1321411 [Trichonephila clavipes]